jgi:hypothetical protein
VPAWLFLLRQVSPIRKLKTTVEVKFETAELGYDAETF